MQGSDTVFAGSIPELYDEHLGPLLFADYAEDLVSRIADLRQGRVLETAAGTGIVTRRLRERLPFSVEIVATDLNPGMLAYAGPRSPAGIEWRQADATALPFEADSFDALLCEFGVMFFPDKAAGYSEAARVLKAGGRYLFNVWGDLKGNEAARVAHETIARLFPDDPPGFLGRVPYGYYDVPAIEAALNQAGFASVKHETVEEAPLANARSAAIGLVQGNPVRSEIEARDPNALGRVTEAVAQALEQHFGSATFTNRMRAHVFEARR
jgi:SAM-dependent methyltransferase